jgi:hypothetical protein
MGFSFQWSDEDRKLLTELVKVKGHPPEQKPNVVVELRTNALWRRYLKNRSKTGQTENV